MANGRKILFIDRDGTVIEEPADEQVDRLDKLRLVTGVIPALLELQAAGYELVLVSNQDGLGSEGYPQEAFEAPQAMLRQILTSQGVRLAAERICPHWPDEGCACRKPRLGLVSDYLADPALDRRASRVIGDRDTDLELARNMGLTGMRLGPGPGDWDWPGIARELVHAPRRGHASRRTRETDVQVTVELDAPGETIIRTGVGFYDHMLEQLAKHGGFALRLECAGDVEVDDHHTVEDTALALGEALREALGHKRGIGRYGFVLPMDEAQARVAVDLAGRPFARFDAELPREWVGGLATEMVPHFFRSLADSLGAAIHVEVFGENTHHMVEASFKGLGRALRPALAREGGDLPSTKGRL